MNALTLPDIAAHALNQALPLDWVGICDIALRILLNGQLVAAKADAVAFSRLTRGYVE